MPNDDVTDDGSMLVKHLAGCTCAQCDNTFFFRGNSPEFIPRYCAYCGIKFIRMRDGEQQYRDMLGRPIDLPPEESKDDDN
jgi:hypothetical protein